MNEFTLTPVDEIPESKKKKRKKKIKVDELEIEYRKKEFPRVYKADYIPDIYKRLGIGGFKTEIELSKSYDDSNGDDKDKEKEE